MMSNPTHGPYVVRGNALRWDENGVTREGVAYTIYAGEDVFTVACHPENAEADAEFIATACNAHADLLAACTKAIAFLDAELGDYVDRFGRSKGTKGQAILDALNAALALAEPPPADAGEEVGADPTEDTAKWINSEVPI